MRLASYFFAASVITMSFFGVEAHTEEIKPFTGKVTRDKVRLRLEPSLDSKIIRQVNRNDLLIVTGKVEDFFQVAPPSDVKAYVYRTFVLDGVIEGEKVNIRLEPNLDSPVITQMNRGDVIVDGVISPVSNKWIQFNPPKETHFYIASEYVEKVGQPDYLQKIESKREEANKLIQTAQQIAHEEFEKPYPEMNLEQVFAKYNKVIASYSEFPQLVERAQELLTQTDDEHLRKKVDYLENQGQKQLENENVKLSQKMSEQKQTLSHLKTELEQANRGKSAKQFYQDWLANQNPEDVNGKMRAWIPVEISLYEKWSRSNQEKSITDFYQDQKREAVALKGVIQSYNRPIRNKPGDYILVNRKNNLPIAYIYSTQVNLENKVGQEVTVEAVSRPNNHFAYPAYFVLSSE